MALIDTVRTFPTDLEIRSDGGEHSGRVVTGIAVPFDRETAIRDSLGTYTEVIRRGAFARTLAQRGAAKVKFLLNHDRQQAPLGRALMLVEDTVGLRAEFLVSKTQAGDEALQLIRDGALDGLSIGFGVEAGGERWSKHNTFREITAVRLHEISATAFPAYQDAVISGVRSNLPPTPEQLRMRVRVQSLRGRIL